MGKISKINQTREEEEAERAAAKKFKEKKSPHWTIGSGIVVNGRTAVIVGRRPDGLVVFYEDEPIGTAELITPINWNPETRSVP